MKQVEKLLSSCTECRRKKAKCDRGQPCSNCMRLSRHCSYETVSRTPLTRKHLTAVEKELANTKALLRRQQRSTTSGSQITKSSSCDFSDPPQPDNPNHGEEVVAERQHHSQQDNTARDRPDSAGCQPVPRIYTATASARRSRAHSPAFSLETLPAMTDFDWDERPRQSRHANFIDGMASLTERDSRGYMGVASGAALLRLADNSGVAATFDNDNDNAGDSRPETPALHPAIFTFSQLEPFVDAYFQTYHVSYPLVHEATFRAQFMEVIPRPKTTAWQVLSHMIAALGSFAASQTAPETDVALFEAAKARMSMDLLETGNLTLVQALILMSNYVQKRNKPNSGYNYMGLAKRMGFGVGLHKELPVWHSQPLSMEIRRRIYWCLYIFDVGATITFSRPLDLPQEGVEIQLPLNAADSDITSTTQRFPQEANEVTLYTHVRCQSQFHLATEHIYSRLISRHFPSAEEMLQEDDACLVKWLNDMPVYFKQGAVVASRYQLCHATLQWRWRNFRILMYRPFLIRRYLVKRQQTQPPGSEAEENAIQRCLDAAIDSIRLITNYWARQPQNVLACWYSLYFLFQASLIPVICLRNEPHSPMASEWRNSVASTLDTMADMGRLNSAAVRCHAVITKLCGAYLAQDMSQWASPTYESPGTQLNALNTFIWPMTDPQLPNATDFAMWETIPMDFVNDFSV